MKSSRRWITAVVLAGFVLEGCGTQQMVKPTDNTSGETNVSAPVEVTKVSQGTPGEASQYVARKARKAGKSRRGVESASVSSGVSNSATHSAKAGPGRGVLVVLGILAVLAVAYALLRRKGPGGQFPPSSGSAGNRPVQMSAGAPQGGVKSTSYVPGASTGPPGPPG